MAEETGFFAALWRFFTFYKLRKTLGITRAADEMFTGSAEGIRDAFDIQKDRMVKQFNELRSAIASVESVLEQKRQRLEALNSEEQDLIGKREGALTVAEQAEGDEEALAQHTAAFERFQSRIDTIESEQEQLEADLQQTDESMQRYLRQMTELQAEIQGLNQQKADELAKFISNTEVIKLNDRLQGLQTSMDRGPLDAVLKANQELSAKARITEKLAGTDVREQDAMYAASGRSSTGKTKMEEMLAARKATQEGKTPTPEEERTDTDRPSITE